LAVNHVKILTFAKNVFSKSQLPKINYLNHINPIMWCKQFLILQQELYIKNLNVFLATNRLWKTVGCVKIAIIFIFARIVIRKKINLRRWWRTVIKIIIIILKFFDLNLYSIDKIWVIYEYILCLWLNHMLKDRTWWNLIKISELF
jgi:hypothetical protein